MDELVVTIFRSRLKADAGGEYFTLAEEMEQLARSMPGFVEFKTFVADDGERLSLVGFDSAAAQEAWRRHPRHRVAQQLGRERFYDYYRIQVCMLLSERTFESPSKQ